MTEFEDYASYLDEDYDQEQQEMCERYCDAEPALDDDNYNDNHHDIPKEEEL